MGRRYQAILRRLGVGYYVEDIDGIRTEHDTGGKPFDRVIIATPTALHVRNIRQFIDLPILCEKPIAKDLDALAALLGDIEIGMHTLEMVNQYQYLVEAGNGPSSYDYFKTGGDGLYWDTINIGALARGDFTADNQSPVWRCTVNGKKLSIADMDTAYMSMIARWLRSPRRDHAYIWDAHVKAKKRQDEYDRFRNSGAQHVGTAPREGARAY